MCAGGHFETPMRLLVLLNPQAHSGRAAALVAPLQAACAARAINAELVLTQGAGDATERIATLGTGVFDGVIAAGGDGTIFEVVNGLMQRPAAVREPLGLLPLGTGNAFARELGLAGSDWSAGLDLIQKRQTRAVDVGEVTAGEERFWFLNMLGAGFVELAGRASLRFKKLGRHSYTVGALSALAQCPSWDLRFELDGEVLEEDTLFFEVANSRYTGTDFLMAPSASIDDGWLDLVLVRRANRRRILRLFPTLFKGTHVQAPEVVCRRAKQIRVLAPAGLGCTVDGEFIGATPLTIQCRAQALELFAPQNSDQAA